MSEYQISEFEWDMAERVAANLAAEYAGYVERDDLFQECIFWILAHPRKATEYLDGGRQGEGKLHNALVNAARKYALKEKAERSGYSYEDVYFYSLEEIERLLPPFFTRDWMGSGLLATPEETGRSSNRAIPSEGGDLLAKIADVAAAYAQLPQHHKLLLRRIYGSPGDPRINAQQEANRNAITVRTQRKRTMRVLGKMRKSLGGKRPYVAPAESE